MQYEFNINDLSPVECKMEYIEKRVENVEKKSENVRRGLFSRHNELVKMLTAQQQELEYLKSIILREETSNFLQLIQ